MKLSKELQEKAEKLAELKATIKAKEERARSLQKELIDAGVACDIETTIGKLAFTVRENYETKDKAGLISFMGQKTFNAHATISKTGVVNGIGQSGFQDAIDKGFMTIKSVSEYFTLRRK